VRALRAWLSAARIAAPYAARSRSIASPSSSRSVRQLATELATIGVDASLRAAVAIAAVEAEAGEGQGDIHARIARARTLL
jgi:hypothetical protein